MTTKPADKNQNFEKSLERLETIVGEMEDGSLSLDKMMARFEEGMRLVQFCEGKLNEVERRIEQLVKKDGRLGVEPFEPEEEPAESDTDAESEGDKTDA